ncbi:hypothetical protein GCM10017083_39860 [Thalassobaculum fulvum]|uniref:Fe/B12 periplasmic-binding domain-containing protein n=1 Tax=Thalassobaculum fulvum TaxID=1633335 RepID=A0A918XUR7_9PROT|nr:ABC transporter substrate-binding protein [Thalassobaculum fulvum]GHD57862.1 hypothetical protein GCM10017083_39860 [Thalassobaculum fulvum]
MPSRPLSRRCLLLLAAAASALVRPSPATAEPKRVVALGGSITETVFALGLGDRLVAVDSTSLYPAEAQNLPNVGYMRALSAEPILALAPDLIMADADAGPAPVLEQVRSAGVPIAVVDKATAVEQVPDKIRQVAATLGVPGAGEALADTLAPSVARLTAAAQALPDKPRVLFLLSIGRGAPLAAGTGTAAAGIIAAAGGIYAIDGYAGYKPISPEAAVAAAPDVVLVTTRTADLLGGPEAILARPDVRPTPAGRDRRLVVMDALLLLGFGPRVGSAVASLAHALHPATDLPGTR